MHHTGQLLTPGWFKRTGVDEWDEYHDPSNGQQQERSGR